jgi:hypothetical protein
MNKALLSTALVVFFSLNGSTMAQTILFKQFPTPLEVCTSSMIAGELKIKELQKINAQLASKAKVLEEQVMVLQRAKAPTLKSVMAMQVSRHHGWHHCKPGRTRNSKGVCGRWST